MWPTVYINRKVEKVPLPLSYCLTLRVVRVCATLIQHETILYVQSVMQYVVDMIT